MIFAAAVGAHRLVGRDWRAARTRREADIGGDPVGDLGLDAETRAQAEALAILQRVQERRIDIAGRAGVAVLRLSAVDRAIVPEDVAIGVVITPRFAAHPQLAIKLNEPRPFRPLTRTRPAFDPRLGAKLAAATL